MTNRRGQFGSPNIITGLSISFCDLVDNANRFFGFLGFCWPLYAQSLIFKVTVRTNQFAKMTRLGFTAGVNEFDPWIGVYKKMWDSNHRGSN